MAAPLARLMAPRPAPVPAHVWTRAPVGWHVAFWVLLTLTTVAVVLDDQVGDGRLGVALGALAVLGLAYATLGGPAATSRSQPRAYGYVATLLVLLPLLLAIDPTTSFLLFLAYPQVWLLVEGRLRGVVATALLTVAGAAGLLAALGTSPEVLSSVGISLLVSFGFSVTLGLWITSIIDQSVERADLVAALERTRVELAAVERAAGAAEARALLARDIHDTLAQGFTSVLMLARLAERELDGGDAAAVRSRLDAMAEVARTNLAEARALVAAASPVQVHGADLVAALHRLGERFQAETGTAVQVGAQPEACDGVTPEGAVVLLRSAQEGLANVRKHASAGRVELRLERDGDGLIRLVVTDDGVGFEPTGSHAAGYGLDGMRRRADDVGGSLEVRPAPGGGTRLAVQVPGS